MARAKTPSDLPPFPTKPKDEDEVEGEVHTFTGHYSRAVVLPNGGLNLYFTIPPTDVDAVMPITKTKGALLLFKVSETVDEDIGDDLRELLGLD